MIAPPERSGDVSVSLVVPTRNEARNVPELLRRVDAVLPPGAEILFVDDGLDDLPAVVRRESALLHRPVRVHRRPEATGGLGGAVVEGVRLAAGQLVVVCDGDLQHPPETIPRLLAAATPDTHVVVASRYRAGGSAAGLSSGFRRLASRGTGITSKALFPLALRGCSDPMSGFFVVRRSSLDPDRLRPDGFKILLEILVRSPGLHIAEVGFVFDARGGGESNASAAEAWRFIRQLLCLRGSRSKRSAPGTIEATGTASRPLDADPRVAA